VTGGGTAGHIYPALTVAAQLAAERDEVSFVGTPDGLEARLVPEAGVRFHALAARGFDRARPLSAVTATMTTLASAVRAWRLLGRERPDVVIGFGAYVSLPVGLAAVTRGIPLVLHEQNSVPGLANRVLSRWARAVGVTYEESAARFSHPERVTHTGNPVRADVADSTRHSGRERLGLAEDETVLLVFGGSRGARHLNQVLVELRDRLMDIDGLRVLQVAGPSEAASVRDALEAAGGDAAGRWRVYDYLSEMGQAIAAADLVVSRAGATTIAELTALGAPALVVPYPYATDDHQTGNAATLVDRGAAVLVADADLDSPAFSDALLGLLSDSGRRATMAAASRALGRPDAAERVVALARRIAGATPANSAS
jgi:UDP-N-acetylglucosamine--N-acetylmuramyl-(pentapeptide) pyrophosphoryl-undecaprenol N-acetylglucosamine transferase